MSPDKSDFETSESLTEEQLRARVAECESSIAQVAELVARARHEINNPLTGVLGQAQLLLREDLPDKVRARVQKIEELALRITEIVTHLREVKRPAERPDTVRDESGGEPPS